MWGFWGKSWTTAKIINFKAAMKFRRALRQEVEVLRDLRDREEINSSSSNNINSSKCIRLIVRMMRRNRKKMPKRVSMKVVILSDLFRRVTQVKRNRKLSDKDSNNKDSNNNNSNSSSSKGTGRVQVIIKVSNKEEHNSNNNLIAKVVT